MHPLQSPDFLVGRDANGVWRDGFDYLYNSLLEWNGRQSGVQFKAKGVVLVVSYFSLPGILVRLRN